MSSNNKNTFFKSFFLFFIKVMIVHTGTYIVFSMLFSNLMNYHSLYTLPEVSSFMRSFDSPWLIAAPFLQPIRALIFAMVLYPFRSFLRNSKLGWLMLWGIFLGIGIIATPQVSFGSIEGFIYTELPVNFLLLGIPEVAMQTLSFSFLLWVLEALPFAQKDFNMKVFVSKVIRSIIIAILGVALFSISNVLLIAMLNIDMSQAKIERAEIALLTAIALLSTVSSYFLGKRAHLKPLWNLLLVPIYFVVYVGVPYLYNYLANTIYNTRSALLSTSMVAIMVSIASFFVFGGLKKVQKAEPKVEEEQEVPVVEVPAIEEQTVKEQAVKEQTVEAQEMQEEKE